MQGKLGGPGYRKGIHSLIYSTSAYQVGDKLVGSLLAKGAQQIISGDVLECQGASEGNTWWALCSSVSHRSVVHGKGGTEEQKGRERRWGR